VGNSFLVLTVQIIVYTPLLTKSSATAEIAPMCETAIQGHSRSSVVVPIDAAYMTSSIVI